MDKSEPDDGEDWYGRPPTWKYADLRGGQTAPGSTCGSHFPAVRAVGRAIVPAARPAHRSRATTSASGLGLASPLGSAPAARGVQAGPGSGSWRTARVRYRADDLSADSWPSAGSVAVPSRARSYTLAIGRGLVGPVFGGRVNGAMLRVVGYVHSAGDHDWWIPSGRVVYHDDPGRPLPRRAWRPPRRASSSPAASETRSERTLVSSYDAHSLLLLVRGTPSATGPALVSATTRWVV